MNGMSESMPERPAPEVYGAAMNSHLFAVILAGGSGTRFWPASRRQRPKQLLAVGPTSDALITATVRRIEPLCSAERTLIATGKHLLPATRQLLPWLPDSSFLGEPVAKNTAPCIAWASWVARRRDPDALVMVLPSDQHIADTPAFLRAIETAVGVAEQGAIVTLGLRPTRPETGYGYIESGAERAPGVFDVARFVEKPDRARAEQYLASGRHHWNSGMFFFRADVLLAAVAKHAPAISAGLELIATAADAEEATRRAFAAFPSISIDYAVMEKAENLAVVPASFGWSDLGSWQTAWELSDKDAQGNVAPGHAVLADARGNMLMDLRSDARERVMAVVGVEGLCVIETDDALLVVPRERAQDVKLVVDALEARGRIEHL
jgi:mannose-1-phosphate guanylyltransferase